MVHALLLFKPAPNGASFYLFLSLAAIRVEDTAVSPVCNERDGGGGGYVNVFSDRRVPRPCGLRAAVC